MAFRSIFSTPCPQTVRLVLCSAAAIFVLLALAGGAVAGEKGVKKPDCAALEDWAKKIDGKDRVMPVEGSRAWIPKAFQDTSFAELFGVPALELTYKDAGILGAHIYTCGKEAGKAGHREGRVALFAARGYVVGNLRGVLAGLSRQRIAKERAAKRAAQQQAREKARAALETKRAAERERLEARRRAEQQAAEAQRRRSAARPQRTVRTPVQQSAAPAPNDPAAGKKLVADYRMKIERLDNLAESLRFLKRWEKEIPQKVTPLAGKAEADNLLELAAAKRESISAYIVAAAKKNIDTAEEKTETNRQALSRIERIAANIAGANVSLEQITEVRIYAREREAPIADRELAAAAKKLDEYPETLKGLDSLQRAVHLARTGTLSRGSDVAKDSYLKAARARLSEIAEEALPQFEEALAELPENPMGLQATRMTVVKEKGFQEVAPEVRADYEAALKKRRSEIAKAIGAREEAGREKAVAAGGDPDLVGHVFVDRAKGWQLLFRDEKQAILASRANRATASYEVRVNEVVVRGPQISLVLKRSGKGAATKLEGLGFHFERKQN